MKRYALCGISNRAMSMFIRPLLTTFSQQAQLVAVLDCDQRRCAVMNEEIPESVGLPFYMDNQFEQMITEQQADVVIVAGRDDTHVDYIVAALERDLDVISEKPMVTTVADCRRVLEAEQRSAGSVTVTFNARYPAIQRRLKELILEGRLGIITSVELNWYIDTWHGASYFKRWNRQRCYSGGLSIHKSTHHFDMVQWLIDQYPEEAFCFGGRKYYGSEGPLNPSREDGRRCSSCSERSSCAYQRHWSTRRGNNAVDDDHLSTVSAQQSRALYTDYAPDMCIFDSAIDVEDIYSATVRFKQGALLNYTANFSSPFEGYRLAINGTQGRLETQQLHARGTYNMPQHGISYYPLFGAPEEIAVINTEGAHGGADPLLQEDLFLGPDPQRPYDIMAASEAGVYAVALGEAMWRSSQSGQPVNIDYLLAGHV